MALNMKTLTQALAKAGAVIEKTVQTTVQEVTGPRPLQDYDLLEQVASGGPGLAWRIFSARPRSSAPSAHYPLVSVWLLDKRALAEARTRAGLSKSAEDAFLDLVRSDAARLVRIRHPGVIHVVQALDESKNAMAMVTEPVFASVANALGNLDNLSKIPKELKGMEMGLLEVKHGLLQLVEALEFLHNNARLVHRAISPKTVFITSSGAWKFGGFGFAVSIDQATGGLTSTQQFHYPEYDVEDSLLPLEPSLNYTAPELVRNKGTPAGSSCDMFSYGCLAYHLITKKPLLDCHNNVKMYMNTLTYLSSESFSIIPLELIGDLQRMLSMNEAARPTALDFTGSSFFRDDTRLRALRFLDHMLERDNMQKSEFLKALSDMWKDFDSRVLRYKVLPPLCSELRNVVLQPVILPMVLTIAESQDRNDFELATLPALIPVLSSASGEMLLLLVKHAELIINKVNQNDLISHVLPLLVRAYDDTDPRIQEEVLRRTVLLARQLDAQLVKQAILSRIHGLALKTTVAAVRVNALRCLGDLVPSLDKQAIMDILQTLQRCTAVDHSAPTLICTLGVANSMYKQYGIEFAAEHIIPLLFPLLTAQQLNVQQFAKFVLFIKDILRKIEEKRGVTITDSGTTEVRSHTSPANGVHLETFPRPSVNNPSGKSNRAWDEDWGSNTKSTSNTSLPLQSKPQLEQPSAVSQPAPASTSLNPLTSASQQPSAVVAPVDIEWPPLSTSSGFYLNMGTNEKEKKEGLSGSSFDDLDPFANWPPKPSNSASSSWTSTTPIQSGSLSGLNMSNISLTSNSAAAQVNPHQGSLSSATNANGPGWNNKHIHQFNKTSLVSGAVNSALPIGSGDSSDSAKGTDLRMIFASSNNGQPTPRIAPPPATAIGRGRGRGQGNSGLRKPSHSSQVKVSSEQPPLMDLL